MKKFASEHSVATSKIVINPKQGSTKTQVAKQISSENAAIKAKTATKITQLVLKPKTTLKNAPVIKMTTKKYSTKPVTFKSRSTLSTMISHESTFHVRNIKKSTPNSKHDIKESAISVKSERISRQLTMNTNYFDTKQALDVNKSFDMEQNEQNTNITSSNRTKTINAPILQEITSTVVNGSNIMNNITNDFVKHKEHDTDKANKHCKNDMKCQKKTYDVTKARKFIQLQREKWNESNRLDTIKSRSVATKDEIKERLNALRKSTLNIVAKNVQKARTNSVQRSNFKNTALKKMNASPKKPTASSENPSGKLIFSLYIIQFV